MVVFGTSGESVVERIMLGGLVRAAARALETDRDYE